MCRDREGKRVRMEGREGGGRAKGCLPDVPGHEGAVLGGAEEGRG